MNLNGNYLAKKIPSPIRSRGFKSSKTNQNFSDLQPDIPSLSNKTVPILSLFLSPIPPIQNSFLGVGLPFSLKGTFTGFFFPALLFHGDLCKPCSGGNRAREARNRLWPGLHLPRGSTAQGTTPWRADLLPWRQELIRKTKPAWRDFKKYWVPLDSYLSDGFAKLHKNNYSREKSTGECC